MVKKKVGGGKINVCVWEKKYRSETTDYSIRNKIVEGASGKIVWNLITKYLKL